MRWSKRWLALMGVAMATTFAPAQGADKETQKRAKAVSSYVVLCETISRIGIQVGVMLQRHPYDKALARYARDLGQLHARFMTNLKPPPGAEDLHRKFTQAVANFARSARARYEGDYPTARSFGDKCMKNFAESIEEVLKLKKRGVIP